MADSSEHERRAHFRGKSRPGRCVELAYRRADAPGAAAVRASTQNIGVGGAFIVTDAPEPVGAELVVSLDVPSAGRIQLTAQVRWRRDVGDPGSDEQLAGMGVKFGELDVDQLLTLDEFFATLTGRDGEAAL